jgi:hypothetical protein
MLSHRVVLQKHNPKKSVKSVQSVVKKAAYLGAIRGRDTNLLGEIFGVPGYPIRSPVQSEYRKKFGTAPCR